MSTSRKLLAQVRRALCAALVLAGCASLLQLVLPFYALHIFESAIPTASLQTVALLALGAACAGVVLIAVVAARDRIVLRAGLWLDHTLGGHILASGARLGTAPAEIAASAAALDRLARALADRTIVAALEAPWLPLMLLALAVLNPILGAVAAGFAALLVLVTLVQARKVGRLAAREANAAARISQWWAAAASGASDRSLRAEASGQWERLNRPRIAAAYALSKQHVVLGDVAGLVKIAAQIVLIAVGAWLVAAHALSPAVLFACVLINAALLDPLQRLVASLPAVHTAMGAYRQLRALPADAGTQHADEAADAEPEPQRLNVRGPLAAGFAAVLLFAAAALGTAYTRLGDLAGLAGGQIFDTRLTPLHFSKLGAGDRVHVREGAAVRAGDVIITRDTTDVDQQIVMLKALSEAARAQLALIGKEATGVLASSGTAPPADKPTVASLEQRVAELEKETQELMSRITRAEQELARSEIRAPVSGRVVALSTGSPEAGGAVDLQIAVAERSLLGRLIDPLRRGAYAAFAPRAAPNERGTP